jgi:hypothetical protein
MIENLENCSVCIGNLGCGTAIAYPSGTARSSGEKGLSSEGGGVPDC